MNQKAKYMNTEVKVPGLPESVADATLATWHKKPGDKVTQGENLVDLETDKVMLEVPAPVDGILMEIKIGDGTTVIAGQILAVIAEGTSATNEVPKEASHSDSDTKQHAAISPAVRRMVEELKVDLSQVTGTGKAGRVTKEDLVDYLAQHQNTTTAASTIMAVPLAPSESAPVIPAINPAAAVAVAKAAERNNRMEQRVPMTRLRARIAERLLDAKNTTAMLTTFNEINMKPVMALRARYKDQFEKAHGVRLGFMSFFVKAVIEGLKKYPAVNASIDGNDVIYHGYFDIGVAVSSPRGLVVPILRDVDQMSVADIEKAIVDYANKAKAGTLTVEEMTGGTFTVTNGGVFGSLLSTPILNPPQSGILGMHKTQDRPIAENGQVIIAPMMYVAHSYDHRIIDGKEAVGFLVTVKECIEDPARILLGI